MYLLISNFSEAQLSAPAVNIFPVLHLHEINDGSPPEHGSTFNKVNIELKLI